jgi:hypothetical protein
VNRIRPHLSDVDLIGKLADLKEEHYRNTLIISAVIELLVDKGIVSLQEIEAKAAELDAIIPDPTTPNGAYPIS